MIDVTLYMIYDKVVELENDIAICIIDNKYKHEICIIKDDIIMYSGEGKELRILDNKYIVVQQQPNIIDEVIDTRQCIKLSEKIKEYKGYTIKDINGFVYSKIHDMPFTGAFDAKTETHHMLIFNDNLDVIYDEAAYISKGARVGQEYDFEAIIQDKCRNNWYNIIINAETGFVMSKTCLDV